MSETVWLNGVVIGVGVFIMNEGKDEKDKGLELARTHLLNKQDKGKMTSQSRDSCPTPRVSM